jgi:hypothetical protein
MKINLLLAITFLSLIIYANIDEMDGIVGLTKMDGGVGCVCHDLNPSDSVFVWIEGPDSVLINHTVQFKLLMTGGAAIAGGFNIASYFGEVDSVDTLTKVLSGQLTHTSPNPFQNDTVSWNFLYTAPDSLVADTIYSVANSVNWDSIPGYPDQWNFGENFVVHVIDNPVYTQNENQQPEDYVLYQNYPNPFNPSTKIKYTIPNVETHRDASLRIVTLKIYDVLGNEVATLVNEEKPAGEYKVEFSSNGLTSGIYFCKLSVGSSSEIKKMVLMK